MASTAILEEDADDFDWEAAVKEIDVACQSTSFPPETSTSRQSTLDRFIVNSNKPSYSNSFPVLQNQDQDQNDNAPLLDIDIDEEAAKTWIYPVNVPLRDYQLSITNTALFSNTLVALPTGLGKTLIAAVVIFNYFRWFPHGKIVFAAPSRPLVLQQIEACHNIVGIPQEWTIDLTGLIIPAKRASFWKTKRVFFVTPQVLEKDIQSGACSVECLVCLVIDEAHRALGNYSYCVVLRELMRVPVPLRILALTATPGSKQQGIQQIIDNLQISTLQYRDESDHDVSPYVHDRKIELIQVAMGEDAVEINNKLLEVIRPFVAKLSSMGILLDRDYKTLSPCDLLNSRDKFRLAPRPDYPHIKYQDVEGFFGVLITLYHIRKLLSSHGIRPASEMLEEKLQQGAFARFMSKNDHICKVRLIMQKSLSHGAPSPKLSKMMEVLLDHFRTKDPQDSRVIIFSNFRGSVRDIMDSLAKIGDVVRATEFIGQSSGKTLKGQSQKVQQAVLEKFRAGGYNVIVATSIGEEGLDIMEVDLVICFDANISPLRMIQRMGRTGRKHDGRVVVLACEGSEVKGYMRKQTNGKSIKKHMRNGGINSFTFHPSPRMIPHTIRPEVQFVKLSIKQFVRPGKSVKDDHADQTTLCMNKLTNVEAELLLKYFRPCKGTWRPSLTAFPHFQTFPSRTHRVMHSSRTMILIDTMQHLQGLDISRDTKAFSDEKKSSIRELFEAGHVEQCDDSKRGSFNEADTKEAVKNLIHYPENVDLFGSHCLSVDAMCKDPISCFPVPSSKKLLHSNFVSAGGESPSCFEQGSHNIRTSAEDLILQTKTINEPPTSETKVLEDEILWCPKADGLNAQEDQTMDQIDVHKTTALKKTWFNEGNNVGAMPSVLEFKAQLPLVDECCETETQLSPRLTNLAKSGFVPDSPIDDGFVPDSPIDDGFVPDSPIDDGGNSSRRRICESAIPQYILPIQVDSDPLLKSPIPGEREMINCNGGPHAGNDIVLNTGQIQSPILNEHYSVGINLCASTSPVVEETRTPLAVLASSSNSEDWHLVTGEKLNSVKKPHRFKRLRKVGDNVDDKNMESMEKTSAFPLENIGRSFSGTRHMKKKKRDGEKKLAGNVQAFIEEEAEVSSDATISDDEEDDKVKSSFDSFIDDRVSASASSTQDETGRPDMMAVYRRSLLSQSPFERLTSPVSMPLVTESASSSGKTLNVFQSTTTGNINQSSAMLKTNHSPEGASVISTTSGCPRVTEVESRKRKWTFCASESVPRINLEKQFSYELEMSGRESIWDVEVNDDEFYEGLDLDAVEAQATLLLRKKVELPPHSDKKNDVFTSPSFDLGI